MPTRDDVIEALRNNEVPEPLLAEVRRVPLPERALSGGPGSAPGGALDDAVTALRLSYHEPLLERGLRTLARGGAPAAGRVGLAGALLGARSGAGAIPDFWTSSDERTLLAALAHRLARIDPSTATARPTESPAASASSS